MRLWCYGVDPGNWGQQLCATANQCGHEAYMFMEPWNEMREGDYAFMRIPQWEPELSKGKEVALQLHERGLKLIPDLCTILFYEDKLKQTLAYLDWMPTTHVLRTKQDTVRDAERVVGGLGLPFVSKSKQASSSVNVRLIKTMEEAVAEYEAASGPGITIKIGKGRHGLQKDYLIWQKFCEGNNYDYRVCINGRRLCILQRDNAHGSPFASGSGKNRPINTLDTETRAVLRKSVEFFEEFDLKWNGIDLVFDRDENDWKVLETTLGWSLPAYLECDYLGTYWKGKDIWRVLLEEISNGVFK